jgi:RNA polymerase sigma-32 factor
MRAQAPHELQTSGDAMLTCSATAVLVQYQRQLRGFPMLQAKEEAQLAKRWREHSDREAAHKLVTSHLRLVVPVARSYRGYGLPISELVSEGNIGLIQAVKGFDPERGLRFSTYAIWWIKAAIREYILRSWSLVKIGTTRSERILFHNLRKEKNRVAAPHDGDMHPEQVEVIAERLGVRKRDVLEMNQRLCGDFSLNVHLREHEHASEWHDLLLDERPDQEMLVAENDKFERCRRDLRVALTTLGDRERYVFEMRRLADEPVSLAALASKLGISRERLRQIEYRAFEKIRRAMKGTSVGQKITKSGSPQRSIEPQRATYQPDELPRSSEMLAQY